MKNLDIDAMVKDLGTKIHNDFDTTWYVEDFLDGYLKAHCIEDEDYMTEENWKEFYNIITEPGLLTRFRETCIQEINERITYLF